MTVKEALQAAVQATVSDKVLEKALIDVDLTVNEAYEASMKRQIDLCAVEVLQGLLSQQDVTEGGYSIKQADLKKIEARLLFLANRYGLSEITKQLKPTVTGKSPW